uniref:Uncharacterized protein n=1 Tax=Glossina brevipalpis TaxID=37001 RepID=A0A1A9W498_9MUSC
MYSSHSIDAKTRALCTCKIVEFKGASILFTFTIKTSTIFVSYILGLIVISLSKSVNVNNWSHSKGNDGALAAAAAAAAAATTLDGYNKNVAIFFFVLFLLFCLVVAVVQQHQQK